MSLFPFKSKKKKKKHILLTLSFWTVLIGVGGVVSYRITAEERFYQRSKAAYECHNITAYNEFRNYLMPATQQRFQHYLEKQAQTLLDQYDQATMSYEAVRDQLGRLQAFASSPQIFEDYRTKLEDAHLSRQAFQTGETYTKQQEWEKARLAYERVLPSDPNYEKAQQALQQVSRWEVDSYLIQALTAFEEKRMEDALAILKKGLIAYPNQPELLQLQSDIQAAIEGRQPLPEHWNRWKQALESRVDEVFEGIHDKIGDFGEWLKKILP